jgi:hypothetical protein
MEKTGREQVQLPAHFVGFPLFQVLALIYSLYR